jgi:hypothetical protein
VNAWGTPLEALPAGALPPCGHGHEVALMRRFGRRYALLCDLCGAVGVWIQASELLKRGWRLDDIEGAAS